MRHSLAHTPQPRRARRWHTASALALALPMLTYAQYVECLCLSDPACGADVCAIDPFCCDIAWDNFCTTYALSSGNLPMVSQNYTIAQSGNGTPWDWKLEGFCNSALPQLIVQHLGATTLGATPADVAADIAASINTFSDPGLAFASSSGDQLTITSATQMSFDFSVRSAQTVPPPPLWCTAGPGPTFACTFNPSIYMNPLGNLCLGDLNGDQVVDGADLGLLLGQWNGVGSADLNDDGEVNGADLGLLLGAFGPCLGGVALNADIPAAVGLQEARQFSV